MDTLRTEHLVKKYGKRTVVDDVSIELTQGEIVGLLGPNGAGKTTTFYMTTGLVAANNGKIFLNDQDITSFPMYKRAKMGIGYLPQEASVFRKMTVEDNIRAVLELTDFDKAYQEAKVEQLIIYLCCTFPGVAPGGCYPLSLPCGARTFLTHRLSPYARGRSARSYLLYFSEFSARSQQNFL